MNVSAANRIEKIKRVEPKTCDSGKAHLLRSKRLKGFSFDAVDDHKQIINIESKMTEEMGLVQRNYTIGQILCCNCGILISPNIANMCVNCLQFKTSVTEGLPCQAKISYCPNCEKYLHPPTTWVKVHSESELLSFCLKSLKKLTTVRLVDAKFLPTEPHSKRMKLRLVVQKEVYDGLFVEKPHTVVYIVLYHKCPSCLPAADPNQWGAVVQVRQYVSHMRTFFYLEQLIIKHQAARLSVKIKPMLQGVDFFFSKKDDAAKFLDFLCKVVPIKGQRFHKQLVSQDSKSNICKYKFNIAAVICPICHEDLIFLPLKICGSLGVTGPLLICTKVRNTITLLDPFTLEEYILSSERYWRAPFKSLFCSRQLIEYIVLDVEVDCVQSDVRCPKYVSADVQIARVSDFGRNDTIFCVKTHLGHLLKPGDFALGYDIYGANINDSEAEQCKGSFPDAILIKKKSEKKKFPNKSKHLNMETDTTDGREETHSEYKQFLRDLEVNPESRFRISLNNETMNGPTFPTIVGEDTMSFSELDDIFADLNLTDGEDGCVSE